MPCCVSSELEADGLDATARHVVVLDGLQVVATGRDSMKRTTGLSLAGFGSLIRRASLPS